MITTENTYGGQKAIKLYTNALKKRQIAYPYDATKHQAIINEIQENGYCVCKNAIDRKLIEALRKDMDSTIRDRSKLKARSEYGSAVNNPLYTVPLCFDIGTLDFLDEIATSYLECKTAIGTTNLRKSYVTSLPERDTLLFHCDRNSIKFLKFFFYLNNVDIDGGPFTYVQGSHTEKFRKWDNKYRWTHKEINKQYGGKRIHYLTAEAGDLIVANTTGFHKGSVPRKTNRMMFTVNYVIHPEDWGEPKEPIRKSQVVPKEKEHLADFLIRKD